MELLSLAYILIYKKYIKNINIYYFTQSGKQLYLQNVNVVKIQTVFPNISLKKIISKVSYIQIQVISNPFFLT